jgi:hypothetical protein
LSLGIIAVATSNTYRYVSICSSMILHVVAR